MWEEKHKSTTSSSLQACFVVAHSSGNLMRKIFTTPITQYNLHNICGAKTKLKEDADHIKNEPKLLIAADKTTNFYKLGPPTYNELLEKNITKSYKKALPETTQAIHKENKDIATKLGIDDRVDTTADKEAFITLKDHKPNFANKPICRLINPTKSEIGKVSKRSSTASRAQSRKNATFTNGKTPQP